MLEAIFAPLNHTNTVTTTTLTCSPGTKQAQNVQVHIDQNGRIVGCICRACGCKLTKQERFQNCLIGQITLGGKKTD